MSPSTRWHRLEAARWVHRLLMLQTVLLGWLTVVVLVGGLIAGMVWVALVPAVLTGLTGWLAHAWQLERRWTWWAAMALAALGAAVDLLWFAAGPSLVSLGSLLVDAALLALLVHPDSSTRLNGEPG